MKSIFFPFFVCKAIQAAFNLPSNVDQAEAQSRWQDAHLNPDQRDFSMADHKFKEVANQVNNDINKVSGTTVSSTTSNSDWCTNSNTNYQHCQMKNDWDEYLYSA